MSVEINGRLNTLDLDNIPIDDEEFDNDAQDDELNVNYSNNNDDEQSPDDDDFQRFGLTTDEGLIKFTGVFLGEGTSKRESHTHRPNTLPTPGRSCSGCRWTETRIFWSEDDQMWVIHTIGRSTIDGENNRYKIVWANKPKDLIDSLMVKSKFVKYGIRQMELPKANAKALQEAAENDDALSDAVEHYGLRQRD